jgi:hypothetical protein
LYNKRNEFKALNPDDPEFSKEYLFKIFLNADGKFNEKIKALVKFFSGDEEELKNVVKKRSRVLKMNNNQYRISETLPIPKISKPTYIAGYILAYSRALCNELFRKIGTEHIYYFDTDSIFTSQPITDKRMVGVDLGQWKCEENNIIDAYFLAPKVYAYFTKDGKEDLHCKGIPTKFLKWNDFVQMYEEKYFLYEKIGFLSHKGNKIKLIDDIQKRIEIRDRKRIYDLDNNTSKPFKTINDYYKHINLNN